MKERQKVEEEWKEIAGINNSQNVNQTHQLEAMRFKMKAKNHNLSKEKSEQILENEMPGMRKAIRKEETQNKYGDDARKIDIGAIGEHGTFIRIPFSEIPEGSLIGGRFVYTIQKKTIAVGHKKTGEYIDEIEN